MGLKGYSKNLIDIQTKGVRFEAKDTISEGNYLRSYIRGT
jgi:hypothetical protein